MRVVVVGLSLDHATTLPRPLGGHDKRGLVTGGHAAKAVLQVRRPVWVKLGLPPRIVANQSAVFVGF
jgi:hypothetical protein